MGCTQAEILRLVELIEYEVFAREPRPRSLEEARERWLRIANTIREMTLDELRSQLGL